MKPLLMGCFLNRSQGVRGRHSASHIHSLGPPRGAFLWSGGQGNLSCPWKVSSRTAGVTCWHQGKGNRDSTSWSLTSLWWKDQDDMNLEMTKETVPGLTMVKVLRFEKPMRPRLRLARCGQWPHPGKLVPATVTHASLSWPAVPGLECASRASDGSLAGQTLFKVTPP